MFIHLSKKIAIPNCSRVRCIAWSSEHEFIACGGENGMLKVIKLENVTKGDFSKNLSINQTLDSHKTTVENVCWNEKFQKLTSSDASGTIIVWMFYKGMWYEEMVNNRQKSLVTGMAWTHDGNKICIVYEDGAIITGSVDGSRLWGKELKAINLNQVEWSPDGKIILIGTRDLEIHIFDYTGNFVKKMPLTNRLTKAHEFICIKWFKNNIAQYRPLIIAFDSGQIQLMRNEADDNPLIINCEMKITSVEWNHLGDMFAVTGVYYSNETNNKNLLKIYNDQGEMLTMIKVPSNEIYDCSWDKNGLKLVLAVDSYMYFANLKLRIPWSFLSNSIVFLKNSYQDKSKTLLFWELKTNKRYERITNNFLQMASWNHYCVVVTKVDNNTNNFPINNNTNNDNNNNNNNNKKKKAFCLSLYNSVGTLIDYRLTSLEVKFCCMNSTRVIVTSNDSFYIWTFKQLYNPNNFKSPHTENLYNELASNISDNENGLQEVFVLITADDKITCITASEKYFLVGHDSGTINQFLLPNASCINKIMINGIPYRMALNRNSSKLALTDKASKFYIYDFEASNEETWSDGKWIDIKYTDIWDFKWETDNNDLIVLLERNKLIVINLNKMAIKSLEPILFHGYLCQFQQLSITTIQLDQLIVNMNDNNNKEININDYIDSVECQYVKNMKELIEKDSMTDAINYALQMPELTSLWTILSQESLIKNLDVETAYLAMIKNKDYKGLQLIKRLNKFKDENLKRAEIYAYCNRFEEAERIYLQIDRPDLALHLNKIAGNFERIRNLLEQYNFTHHEKEIENVNLNLGEHYADNYDWHRAIEHFEKINAYEKLVECYINEEKYEALISLIEKVNNEKTLLQIGMFLESMGFCKDSVQAYIKANNFEMAINACVNLSEWKMATELANQYKTKNIDILLEKYVRHLEADQKYIEMIEVFRKANRIDEAVKVILKLILEIEKKSKDNADILKKFYVLIGILYEENKAKNNQYEDDSLNELLSQNDSFYSNQFPKIIEDSWKGAEAYHFFLLTQRYLYQNEYDSAMNTALHLQNYEEYLTREQIYSMIALTAYANKCFDICSKAFIKLESLGSEYKGNLINDLFYIGDDNHKIDDHISEEKINQYEQLAVKIFLKNPPNEELNAKTKVNCKFCGEAILEYSISCSKCRAKFPVCVASGRSIMDPKKNWICKRCNHYAIPSEISSFNNCPLCHEKIHQ